MLHAPFNFVERRRQGLLAVGRLGPWFHLQAAGVAVDEHRSPRRRRRNLFRPWPDRSPQETMQWNVCGRVLVILKSSKGLKSCLSQLSWPDFDPWSLKRIYPSLGPAEPLTRPRPECPWPLRHLDPRVARFYPSLVKINSHRWNTAWCRRRIGRSRPGTCQLFAKPVNVPLAIEKCNMSRPRCETPQPVSSLKGSASRQFFSDNCIAKLRWCSDGHVQWVLGSNIRINRKENKWDTTQAVLAETSHRRLVPNLFAIDRRVQFHNLVFTPRCSITGCRWTCTFHHGNYYSAWCSSTPSEM